MSGSIRLTGVNGLPLGGSGLRYPGVYAALDFANNVYELGGVSRRVLTALPGFTFTRASLAMGYDATGKLTYGPNNLLLQSQTFGTTWVTDRASITSNTAIAPDGTLTADSLIEDTTASNSHRASQSVTTRLQPYVFSVYLKANTRTWAYLRLDRDPATTPHAWFNLATGAIGTVMTGLTASITSVGNGWYRCAVHVDAAYIGGNSFIIGPAIVDGSAIYTGDGTSGIYLWGAQLEAVTYQTTPSTYYPTTSAAYYGPRLVYDPVTLASLGILVEEARTNSAVQSQTLDNASWIKERSSVTANAVTSPDGTTNADKLVEDATAANSHRATLVPTTTSSAWTFSIYAKADTRSWLYIRADRSGATTPQAWFNVSTGTVGTVQTGFTASIQSVGNGWYRCVVTLDAPTAAPNTLIFGLSTGNGVSAYNGDGTSGLYLWQAQAEAGTGASSPIPTTTASVTRAADVPVLAISLSNGGLTVVSEARGVVGFTGNAGVVGLDDGTDNNRLVNYTANSTGLRAFAAVGGATTNIVDGTATDGATFKQATAFDGVDRIATSGNGSAVATGTRAITPAVFVNMRVGGTKLVSNEFRNGTISRIRIYKSALSDAQLQSITS